MIFPKFIIFHLYACVFRQIKYDFLRANPFVFNTISVCLFVFFLLFFNLVFNLNYFCLFRFFYFAFCCCVWLFSNWCVYFYFYFFFSPVYFLLLWFVCLFSIAFSILGFFSLHVCERCKLVPTFMMVRVIRKCDTKRNRTVAMFFENRTSKAEFLTALMQPVVSFVHMPSVWIQVQVVISITVCTHAVSVDCSLLFRKFVRHFIYSNVWRFENSLVSRMETSEIQKREREKKRKTNERMRRLTVRQI